MEHLTENCTSYQKLTKYSTNKWTFNQKLKNWTYNQKLNILPKIEHFTKNEALNQKLYI